MAARLETAVEIPIKDGISEGGLIVVAICSVVLALLVLAIITVWKFGADIRRGIRAVTDSTE